ncbi:MAG: retroviral-like aspartic protease family protein [Acidobacteriales bacterium]|nr:retroviral-like aspartic protease family protein [Terriglobales bacterium]
MKRLLLFLLLCLALPVGAQSVPIESNDTGLLVTARIGERAVVLLVDTGAAFTHLDSRFLRLPRAKRTLRTMTGAGETNLLILEPVKLALAERTFDLESLDVDLAAHRKQCGCDVAGVLGLDVLRRFSAVTLDFEARTMILRRTEVATK